MKNKTKFFSILFTLSLASCATPRSTSDKITELNNMEGKYTKAEAIREFGNPPAACIDHTWTESCKWEFPVNDGRSPANESESTKKTEKNSRTLRLWFDKKGILVKKNFQ